MMIPLDEVPLHIEDEKAVNALAELSAPSANRGLVVDNGHLAGLVPITDLAQALEMGRRPAQHRAIEPERSRWWIPAAAYSSALRTLERGELVAQVSSAQAPSARDARRSCRIALRGENL
jgi:hypothetical protein